MEAAVASEVEPFLTLVRGRLATEGWGSVEWVEAGLREAFLKDGRRRLESWEGWLWEGQVDRVVRAAQRHVHLHGAADPREAQTQSAYFEKNGSRMRYGQFRRQGWFIGSGVVEAGCKTVVGQRAKQSGMRWSETGAPDRTCAGIN